MFFQIFWELYIGDFSRWFPRIFHSSCVSPQTMFFFQVLNFNFLFVFISHFFTDGKLNNFFYVSHLRNTSKNLATILLGKKRQKIFESLQKYPVLLLFPSWIQPSKLTDQTELQRVDTTCVFNSSPEWKWKFLRIRINAKAFEVSFPSLEFASQALLTSVPIDYKNCIAAKSIFWTFAKNKTNYWVWKLSASYLKFSERWNGY